MYRLVTWRACITVSYFGGTLLLVLSDRTRIEGLTVFHNWMGMADRKLDHHVIRQLRLRVSRLGNDFYVSSRFRSDIMATSINILRNVLAHSRNLHLRQSILTSSRHAVRGVDSP